MWDKGYLHERLEDREQSECAKNRLKKRARNEIDRTVDPVPKAREPDWTGPNTIEERLTTGRWTNRAPVYPSIESEEVVKARHRVGPT